MGEKWTLDIRNFYLRKIQVRKREKICMNQSLIHTSPFPLSPFLHSHHNSLWPENIFLGRKNWGGIYPSLLHPPRYACKVLCFVYDSMLHVPLLLSSLTMGLKLLSRYVIWRNNRMHAYTNTTCFSLLIQTRYGYI